ncbi:MAG: HAD hydrolase-like protein, partial [Blautia sp.]|nr:HAD hydrolase-like protein [Blautia sp.]
IAGASLDASRENKSAVIAYLLEKQDVQDAIMIGDTDFDVLGAKEHAIPCIGVNWGYGNKQSMIEAGAVTVVDTVEQLEEYLKKNA